MKNLVRVLAITMLLVVSIQSSYSCILADRKDEIREMYCSVNKDGDDICNYTNTDSTKKDNSKDEVENV